MSTWAMLAAEVTNLPTSVPSSDRLVAVLAGLGGLITAVGGVVTALVFGRRRADDNARAENRELWRVIRDLRADLLDVLGYAQDCAQAAVRSGARPSDLPRRPVLRSEKDDDAGPAEDGGP